MVRQQQRKQQKREAGDGKDKGKPPAVLTRMPNGTKCRYNYVKTVHSIQELDDFRFEHKCHFWNVKNSPNFKCVQLRCHNEKDSCPFALLAWRPGGMPDKKNQQQIHVYASSRKHNHRIAPADERKWTMPLIWPDEQPLAEFSTSDGREWTYMETTTTKANVGGGKALIAMLEKLKRKYHCRHKKIKDVLERHTVCRLTLHCSAISRNCACKFAMMTQRTDRDRFHLYASDVHTCVHENKVTRKSLTKGNNRPAAAREEEENEEEDEVGEQQEAGNEQEEDEMEEEELDEEDDEMDDGGGLQEFGEDGEENDEEAGEKQDEEDEKKMEQDEEQDDEKEEEKKEEQQEMVANGTAAAAMPAAMINNPNGADGRKDVEFLDFVDHPKNGGVKLRRLGELKKEAGAPMIIMDQQQEEEQPPANNKQQNRKAPKREIKEEPAGPLLDNEQRKEHRQQLNAKYAHGTPSTAAAMQATVPAAMINPPQNHQQQPAMNRRHAEKVAAPPNNNGQQRLLRERKGRINYRE